MLKAAMLSSMLSANDVAYIYGDVSEDGDTPSVLPETPYEQMLLTDTGDLGLSSFKSMVEAQGYTINQYYAGNVTLDAAFLNQYDVVIFGLHQKIWSATEKTALDTWLQAGGGMLIYSDAGAGGYGKLVGNDNSVGQSVVNNLISDYGMEVTLDLANGVRSFQADAVDAHPIVSGSLIMEGEGVSPVVVDTTDPLIEVVIPYSGSNVVTGNASISSYRLQNVTIPTADREYAVIATRPVGSGNIVVNFDRQPMWNNGSGSDIFEEDNYEILRRTILFLADDLATSTHVPALIEAEDYDEGGQGVAYSDTTSGNQGGEYRTDDVDIDIATEGGYFVGWTSAGEYLNYTIEVADAGNFDFTVRVSSGLSSDKTFHLEIDGVDVTGPVVFNTGGAGWQSFQDVVVTDIPLSAGVQELRLVMDSGAFNVTSIDVQESSSTLVALPRSSWTLTGSPTWSFASEANAIDGDSATRWATGQKQTPGQLLTLDLGATEYFSSVVLETDANPNDFPVGYILRVSNDGVNYTTVTSGAGAGSVTDISFAEQSARYIQIEQTGTSTSNWWSVHELNVYQSGAVWTSEDIGAVAAAGSASINGSGQDVILASGADIWGTADEFHYVHQPLSGDGEITVEVVSLVNTNQWAKAGVMIRESLDADSANAAVFVTPTKGVSFQRRVATAGNSVWSAGTNASASHWLRLNRSGNVFTASESTDGVTWTVINTDTISMASDVYVGLAVTSHSDGVLTTAVMDNVSVQ